MSDSEESRAGRAVSKKGARKRRNSPANGASDAMIQQLRNELEEETNKRAQEAASSKEEISNLKENHRVALSKMFKEITAYQKRELKKLHRQSTTHYQEGYTTLLRKYFKEDSEGVTGLYEMAKVVENFEGEKAKRFFRVFNCDPKNFDDIADLFTACSPPGNNVAHPVPTDDVLERFGKVHLKAIAKEMNMKGNGRADLLEFLSWNTLHDAARKAREENANKYGRLLSPSHGTDAVRRGGNRRKAFIIIDSQEPETARAAALPKSSGSKKKNKSSSKNSSSKPNKKRKTEIGSAPLSLAKDMEKEVVFTSPSGVGRLPPRPQTNPKPSPQSGLKTPCGNNTSVLSAAESQKKAAEASASSGTKSVIDASPKGTATKSGVFSPPAATQANQVTLSTTAEEVASDSEVEVPLQTQMIAQLLQFIKDKGLESEARAMFPATYSKSASNP